MSTNSDYERSRLSREVGRTGTGGMATPSEPAERDAIQRTADKADELKDRVTDKADELKDRAGAAGQQATERVDAAMTATGERLNSIAQRVHESAPSGQAGEAAHKAAQALERSGEYLQRADPQMVRSDLERIIRDHPLETLAIGLGIGFLIGKSRSSRRSYHG